MLEIRDLHFAYGKHGPEVLRGLELTLDSGQIGILLGKNGAGKSTLFSNILGIENPLSGELLFGGEDIGKLSVRERARRIAYVPQQITFGELTVFDSVLLGRLSYFGLRSEAEDRRITAKIIEDMGLSDLSGRIADQLSGGEKQKVAIARAIAQDPKMIVFDEPTGNLDLANEQLLIREIRTLSDKGITVFVALHDLNTALTIGGRFYFMKDGKIRYAVGKTEITAEMIREIFDADVELTEVNGRTVVLGKI